MTRDTVAAAREMILELPADELPQRKPYQRPTLTVHGTVAALTQVFLNGSNDAISGGSSPL